ncbi:MAG: head-tail adaptor protein [Eubacteriales bacterium]|nr:head-tail adaptor protein [Eubacteriales bacterium]MDD4390314.1 head-tail adaptor protein [Eubacteriales bacterium]
MSNLSSRLNSRIDVYSKAPTVNGLGEDDFVYAKTRTVWAEITPGAGTVKDGEGDTVYSDISHKIVIRKGAISDISNDMYFIFSGQRYDIKHFNPNYKYGDRIEIFCSLVVE